MNTEGNELTFVLLTSFTAYTNYDTAYDDNNNEKCCYRSDYNDYRFCVPMLPPMILT